MGAMRCFVTRRLRCGLSLAGSIVYKIGRVSVCWAGIAIGLFILVQKLLALLLIVPDILVNFESNTWNKINSARLVLAAIIAALVSAFIVARMGADKTGQTNGGQTNGTGPGTGPIVSIDNQKRGDLHE